MASLLQQLLKRKWTIESMDPEVSLFIESQYKPDDGWQDDADPVVSGSLTPGSRRPSTQWVAGGPRRVRMRSSFRSLHFNDDIRPKIALLRALRNQDAGLGRAPRVRMTQEDQQIVGFVVSCPIRITGYWQATGLPRAVAFEVEVAEAEALNIDTGSPVTGETQFVFLGAGESFESLGKRFYGSALRGELLRRQNPALAGQEAPGDLVKVLEAEHPSVRRPVRPSSPPLLESVDGSGPDAVVVALAEEQRNGLAWDQLPEVLAGEVV